MNPRTSLSTQQEAALESLVGFLVDFADRWRLQAISASGGEAKPRPLSREENFATFALFGPRGAGKSTLSSLLPHTVWTESKGRILVLDPPLECTSLPDDIHFGISLGEYLTQRFLEDPQPAIKCRRESSELNKVLPSLQALSSSFLPLDHHYRDLKLSLAVTSSEYQQIAQKELGARPRMRRKVGEALTELFTELGRGSETPIEHLVVVLEDADLSVGNLNAQLLSSFLTDFNDQRLIFLVVADEEHLEHRLSQSRSIQGDTVLRMLDKLIPVNHRVYLRSWAPAGALHFEPLSRDNQGAEGGSDDLEKRFRETLPHTTGQVSNSRLEDFLLLLPTTPRGLGDLYQQLGSTADLPGDELLPLLAHCRGAHGLARRLSIRPADWYAARVAWKDSKLRQASWSRIVSEALSEGPIWALAPSRSLFPELETSVDEALWTEILLDLSSRQSYEFLRSIFIDRFQPLKDRIKLCNIRFRRSYRVLRLLAEENAFPFRSLWVDYPPEATNQDSEGLTVEIGWSQLILGDPGLLRRRFLNSIVSKLALSDSYGRSDELPEVAPRHLRSLILLVDQVARLPWEDLEAAMAGSDDWGELPQILGLFCAPAYQRALRASLERERRMIDPGQASLDLPIFRFPSSGVEALMNQPPDALEDHIGQLTAAWDQCPPEAHTHPLAVAFKNFLRFIQN